jgi:hypothetical protein
MANESENGAKHRNSTGGKQRGGKLRPPWKKGESGNPKGRTPKELCLTSIVKAELEAQAKDRAGDLLFNKDGTPRTWAQVVGTSIVRQAAAGRQVALKELWDRIDGKVPLPIEASGPGGGPLKIEVKRGKLRQLFSDPELSEAAVKIARMMSHDDGQDQSGD